MRRPILRVAEAWSAASAAVTSAAFWSAAPPSELRLMTWSNFVDQPLFDKFTQETGIKIVTDVFDSDDQMMAKLQAGASP